MGSIIFSVGVLEKVREPGESGTALPNHKTLSLLPISYINSISIIPNPSTISGFIQLLRRLDAVV